MYWFRDTANLTFFFLWNRQTTNKQQTPCETNSRVIIIKIKTIDMQFLVSKIKIKYSENNCDTKIRNHGIKTIFLKFTFKALFFILLNEKPVENFTKLTARGCRTHGSLKPV